MCQYRFYKLKKYLSIKVICESAGNILYVDWVDFNEYFFFCVHELFTIFIIYTCLEDRYTSLILAVGAKTGFRVQFIGVLQLPQCRVAGQPNFPRYLSSYWLKLLAISRLTPLYRVQPLSLKLSPPVAVSAQQSHARA